MKVEGSRFGCICLSDYILKGKESGKLERCSSSFNTGISSKLLKDKQRNHQIGLKKYLRIDLSFLSKSTSVNHNLQNILLPSFSVHHFINGYFHPFSVNFKISPMSSKGYVQFFNGEDDEQRPDLFLFSEHLIKSTEFYKAVHNFDIKDNGQTVWSDGGSYKESDRLYEFKNLPRDLRKKYKGLRNMRFTYFFQGIIPKKTKKSLKKAERIFGNLGIYLIAEAEPKNWESIQIKDSLLRRTLGITKDPLLIGFSENRSYLIDHFNTTPIENYARREFTS